MQHLQHIEDIAPVVAVKLGLDWRKLPRISQDAIRAAVRDTPRLSGQTDLEKAAGTAIDEWCSRQEATREAERLASPAETSQKPKASPKPKQ